MTVNRNTANAFIFTDACNMDSELRPVFDSGAVWLMRKKTRNRLRRETITAASNQLVLTEYYTGPQSAEKPAQQFLLGYPVLVTEKVPDLGSYGDVILGNFAHYLVGSRKGFTSRVSYDFKFDEDLTSWRFVGRLDGIASIPEAFVLLDGASGSS